MCASVDHPSLRHRIGARRRRGNFDSPSTAGSLRPRRRSACAPASAGNRAVTAVLARDEEDGAGVIRSDGEYRISERRYRKLIGDGTTRELWTAHNWLMQQLSPSLEPVKS
jgi:hypothetical protein